MILTRRVTRLQPALLAALGAGCCPFACDSAGRAPSDDTPPQGISASLTPPAGLLTNKPTPLEFGVLAPGRMAERDVTVRNGGPTAVDVRRVQTSCPCIRVEPCALRIDPGHAANLVVQFNPQHEPEFRGVLCPVVTGHGPKDAILFRIEIRLTVAEKPPGGSVAALSHGSHSPRKLAP